MDFFLDRYDGITIDKTTIPSSLEQFQSELDLILHENSRKNLLWIQIEHTRTELISTLISRGFEFHHCHENSVILVLKIQHNPTVPTARNFTVGVGGIVFHKGDILVVKDRFQKGYKLPGGHIDNNERIKDALKREVFEETGVVVTFESIVNVGHFTVSQFGASNLYLVCTAKVISSTIAVHDTHEIEEARWMNIQEFLIHPETNNYNREVVTQAMENPELKLTDREVTLQIPHDYELFL